MYYITYRFKLYMVFDWSEYKIYISIIDITCRSKKGCLGYYDQSWYKTQTIWNQG